MGKPENASLLAEWSDWMEAQGLSDRTQELYRYSLLKLLCFRDPVSRRTFVGRCLLELSEGELVLFLASFKPKAHSKAQHRKALRSFYGWAHRRGYLARDPTAILDRARKPRRTRPEPYHPEELRRLVDAAKSRDPRRAWAILACFALGTRRSEFAAISPADIDWIRGVVHLRRTKGDRPRDVPLSPLARLAIEQLRPWWNGTIIGGVRPSTFGAWVKQAARDAGLPPGRKHRSHTLRSTFATWLDQAGAPTGVIQQMLGHESLATTSAYVGLFGGDAARWAQVIDDAWLHAGLPRALDRPARAGA
ncbi:MAG TPA: tyrosine-type recombinase/integrase [Actinomycetota bacterium]|nr:tyrosine-type recombinase/integrase [Actinomycetota bacterium]